ncbi:uncharacterized protein LOC103497649 [Cucumis melo]|uniref:Uncharacterized protein LOC103497649 n=1 Tax=Cucumis melo TaxID=3656 RepID=A0A1S3C6M7_CUCME|nr:uncharacterized protein LOC103497649 [Cucumis melo]
MGSLQSHELRLKQFDVNPEEAFQMQTSLRGSSHGRRGGHGIRGGGRNYDNRSGANSENSQESSSLSRGRESRRGRGFGRNQGGGRGNFSHIQCFNCRKYGHFQGDCWALKNGDGNTTMNMHKEQKKNDEGILFLACSVQDDVVESTCEVKTGDNTRLQVKGQGDMLVKTKKGTKRVTNVFYVPGLKHNLLSIGQLLQRGLKVSFEGDICAIKDQVGVLIAKKVSKSVLFDFCDSDWGGNVDDHKSTSGYVFSMGSGVFSWTSKKQSVVALSTTEEEYISLAAAGCQAL